MAGCWLQPTALSVVVAYRSCPMDQELVPAFPARCRWGKGVAKLLWLASVFTCR